MRVRGLKLADRSAWLVPLFLSIGVLLPTGGVLWFMNQAMRSQAQTARQSVQEAYRSQLRLLRDRLNALWQSRAAGIEHAADFPAALAASRADAVILLDEAGQVRYPSGVAVPPKDPLLDNPEWVAAETLEQGSDLLHAAAAYQRLAGAWQTPQASARAARAAIRCLVRAGRKREALALIERYFAEGPISHALDSDGRLIAIDEHLLALRILKREDPIFPKMALGLSNRLSVYGRDPIPSAQRVFAMRELRAMVSDQAAFPTQAAEELGLAFLDTERARPGPVSLQASGVPDVWKLTSANRRTIALYRTSTVMAEAEGVLSAQNQSRAVEFGIAAPGASTPGDEMAAGTLLPGWQIWFALRDTKAFEQAARRQMATYIWVGYLVIAGVMGAGLILGQTFRRQSRLARLKTDLVANVSHELKTPLASMRLLVETLIEDDRVPPETTREYLQMIASENLRLTRLIDNFLTFSRIERQRQQFAFEDVEPGEVVDSAMRSFRERLQSPECRVEVDVTPGLPPLRADRDALVTVLLNLLDNAWKYTRGEKHLAVRAFQSGGRVVFAVKDNGIGIAAREQRRIFRRFYQVDRRLAREAGGCGLGLSIVDFIVRAHGGEVQVQSAPGAGSTFSVFLPFSGGPGT